MSDKLQELTDRLYNEGLSKGREEGELLLAKARQDAADIVAKAQAEAEALVAQARKSAEELKSKAESDIRMASQQSLQATRHDIENLLLDATVSDKVEKAAKDPGLIKEVILAVAQKFSAEQATDISLVLPEALKAKLEPWLGKELAAALKAGVTASFSKKLGGGFTIGPKDGSWFIDLSDESFKALISEYLRPVTRKLLFG